MLIWRDRAKKNIAINEICADQKQIENAWKAYYPSGIASEEERELAEKIKSNLPSFLSEVDEAIAALSAENYEAVQFCSRTVHPTQMHWSMLPSRLLG